MINPKDYILSVGNESVLFAHKVDLLLEEDEIDEALELCEEGVKRFPFYTEGYVQLARCYQLKNMNDEAVKAYQQALNLHPGHVKALKGLAYLYYKMRERELGEATLLKAYLFNPYDDELHEFLESEGLLARLYMPPIFEEEDDASQHEGAMLDLEEILDDSRPTDEDERNQILEEIDEHSNVSESELFNVETSPQEEIDKIDESFFEIDSGLNEADSDSFPDDLSAVTPGLGAEEEQAPTSEQSETIKEEKPEKKASVDEREEFTQWMSDLFKPEEQTAEDEQEISEERQGETVKTASEQEAEEEQILSDLDTILIFSDHRKGEIDSSDEEDEEEGERPLGDFNALEEDLERISSTEFNEIEKHMVEPESDLSEAPAFDEESEIKEQAEEKPSSDVDEVLKRLEESEKKRDDSSIRRVEIDQMESQAESDNVNIEDILSNPSLLTSTFGEILIAQHKFEDALKVFKALAEKDPENPRLQKKIDFLKKLVAAKK
ncbi:MAG: tetratricopeptide repeat protein [Caldisericaceae bacterium]|nr:tetratricopeptide repeat protein [Caldisericaceae bacterium]